GEDRPGAGYRYNLPAPGKVSRNAGSAASHAFEQYIGPALARGGMGQHIRGCVDFRETLLGLATQKTDAICNSKLACHCFDTASLWPFSYDCEINLLQV